LLPPWSSPLAPSGLKVGGDLYYKFARNGVDFGQFGALIITIPFNYRIVANRGIELTTTYENGALRPDSHRWDAPRKSGSH
jgi:hypothetical protein